jgi:glycosyltransferase involved in cell wall biosynthesis
MTPSPTRPRLLFVTPVSPFNAGSGSAQRSQLLLRALQANHEVDVLELREAPALCIERQAGEADNPTARHVLALVPPWRNPLRRFQPQPALQAGLETALGRSLASYALVVGRYLWPISQLPANTGVRMLVDLDDWRYRVDPAAPWQPGQVALRLKKALAHRLAQRAIHRFTAAFSVSAQDHAELQAWLPVTALPNVYPPSASDLGPTPQGARLLFVGAMWYRPNAEAMDWFLSQVWPQVRAARPDAELVIAGAGPEPTRQAWARHPGVSAPGFVADLQATYRAASLVIVPILGGGGSNIKVLEAMAHRRPCLVSALVAGAFADRLQPGQHFLLGRNATEFAQQVLHALAAPAALQTMTDAAWAAVHTGYSPEGFTKTVQHAVHHLLSKAAT